MREVVGAAWRCVQGQRLRTGKSRARESGGSADALLDAAAFEAARDAPSHELHDRTGSRSRKLVAWRRLAEARESCATFRPDVRVSNDVIRQGRERTD